jgi:uncharacterized protein
MEVDWTGLQSHVLEQFRLDLKITPHGPEHWERVAQYGLYLARHIANCDTNLVRLFAYLHDSQRYDEGRDLGHGARAAEFVSQINGRFFSLEEADLKVLCLACRDHESGYTSTHPTIGSCWDSDRLDLDRVGINVDSSYLSTATAQELSLLRPLDRRRKVTN